MAGTDPRIVQDLESYIAPAFAGYNPLTGADLTRFLYLEDASYKIGESNARQVSALPKVTYFTKAQTWTSLTSAGETKQIKINGGYNAVVLGFSVAAYDPSGLQSINQDLITYEERDENGVPLDAETAISNLAGTGTLPGLLLPRKWLGASYHDITLKNNSAVASITVKISWKVLALYALGQR